MARPRDPVAHYCDNLSRLATMLASQWRRSKALYQRLDKAGHPCAQAQLLYCNVVWSLQLRVLQEEARMALGPREDDDEQHTEGKRAAKRGRAHGQPDGHPPSG